ncbi:restriction endonuclease subunit S [Microcoleus sp. MOSTC5]|uniref:restriction endonuclease subunit S n=1 Tax=Microcoleus sp. MOSTC5 TaxID=3055378 RepID=UPI002FD510A4
MRETVVKTEEFKDSPLGRIPKDWDVKPLSELADVDRGKFTHRPRNDPRFYGGSYPFIQTGDIANSSGGILSTYSQTLNERGITVSREFPVGTIAITIAANIADTAILGIPMFFPDSVVGAVVKKPNSIRYVELCIRRAKQRLDARAPQSAQKNINLEDLRPLLIPVPSPEEQHRIAEVIDTIDSTIAHTSSLIAKLKQMKAGLLHDLLTRGLDENGELRDAITHPEQFKDSPLGQIPKDWEIRPLTSLTQYITYGFTNPMPTTKDGPWMITAFDIARVSSSNLV